MKGKVLITGGSGFIGKALTRYLKGKGTEVISPGSRELDVSDKASVERFSFDDISHIIHMAGRTFVPKSWEEPGEFFRVNSFGTLNILEVCRKNSIPLTYISAYVYGPPAKIPIAETDCVNPNNPYARSKYMAEELCGFYAKEFGVKCSVIRPFNVYGPGQGEDFLIPVIMRQVMKADTIKVMDLSPKRDYVYIDDLSEAIYLTIGADIDYDVFNIGSGISYSVGEVVDMAQKIAGVNKPVESKNQVRRNELNNVVADIFHAKEVLGWEPKYTLEQGLANLL